MSRWVLIVCALLCSTGAHAQDLFELEVFDYETTPAGDYAVGLHTNLMSRGGVAADSVISNHRPVHVSVEVVRGWTDRFETGLFVQTAPFGATQSSRFAGGHLRSKFRLGELPLARIKMAFGAEYTFNRHAFDRELQTLELRPILEFGSGRLSLIANPSLEMVLKGSDEGLEPTLDLSARASWQWTSLVALATEYFSRPGTTRHLAPETTAHHLVFTGIEIEISSRWELGVSAGHCVTSDEPWLVKSVLGYRF